MEDFLDTLPSFVHDYLNKYPIDVLSLLKELVCFAVLYSNDRDILYLLTEQLLREGEKKVGVPELTNAAENMYLKEDNNNLILKDRKVEEEKNKEWMVVKQTRVKKEDDNQMTMTIDEKPKDSLVPFWIPWKEDHPKKSKSQISIPEMSSYREISSDHLAFLNNLDMYWKVQSKKRCHKSPILIHSTSTSTSTNTSQRSSSAIPFKPFISLVTLSNSSTPRSPISPLSLKPISFNENQTMSPPPMILRKSISETTNNFTLQRPGSTFTVQARINHARRKVEELERKKLLAMMPLETSISRRLKRRINSGIDWKAIKAQGKIALTRDEH